MRQTDSRSLDLFFLQKSPKICQAKLKNCLERFTLHFVTQPGSHGANESVSKQQMNERKSKRARKTNIQSKCSKCARTENFPVGWKMCVENKILTNCGFSGRFLFGMRLRTYEGTQNANLKRQRRPGPRKSQIFRFFCRNFSFLP